ncbi:hypothetical protein N7449_006302 [Penicillium cf. viridicatum]|uniref:Uncharacterized protein n=1 Tax=Penicillium cf. viridicatum TaxID=2972119 RepID=A0A9W9JF33_9EURO|nr:hypothetical protein N7449_006302 [Penicillium cf. viridicatum]
MFVFSGSLSMDGVKGISCGKSRLLLFWQFNHLKKLFALLLEKNNISCTSHWLAQSEDIRSTEAPDYCFNLWALLKATIYELRPDLIRMPHNDTTKEILVATAQQAWDELELWHLEHLSETMPHRVEAIIESQGWYTPYYISATPANCCVLSKNVHNRDPIHLMVVLDLLSSTILKNSMMLEAPVSWH